MRPYVYRNLGNKTKVSEVVIYVTVAYSIGNGEETLQKPYGRWSRSAKGDGGRGITRGVCRIPGSLWGFGRTVPGGVFALRRQDIEFQGGGGRRCPGRIFENLPACRPAPDGTQFKVQELGL